MQKETILARIRATLHFSEATVEWFEQIKATNRPNSNIWFADERNFFAEFRGTWEGSLVNTSQHIVNFFFLQLGLSEDKLPKVQVYESYLGSWVMEAAITMFGSIGTAYTILKGISELPAIADGLTELKDRLKGEFSQEVSTKAKEHLSTAASRFKLPPPPQKPIVTDFVLDARPLLALTPASMKGHKVHMSVAISRDTFALENLGQEDLRDIRIGIFKGTSRRNQWAYADSYVGNVAILSAQQTITKDNTEFRNSRGDILDLSDNSPLYVDCWVQDTYGIYLFMFYLD